ncbi:MAG TPA: sulfite exporter TauE/SafE family protein [Acidimicrobiales bacterium]|nr:sulfite exporter TauE/SafE family protein [Acidimicrobiales bacterium]
MSTAHTALIVLAGVGAGFFNGVAGGGSLISFPLLLALGYPALTANVTNTIGIWPGYLGSAAGFRAEITGQRGRLARLSPASVIGAVLGAVLLLTTSSATFTRLAPWLVLGATALFAAQPFLRRALDGASPTPRDRPLILMAGTFVISVYGGYFGAGMGVMLMAVLGLALPDSIGRTSGLRSLLSMLVNGVAAAVFLIHGGLAWQAVGLLAAGSLIGGWIGARVSLAIPAAALRAVVIVIGLGTAVRLLV